MTRKTVEDHAKKCLHFVEANAEQPNSDNDDLYDDDVPRPILNHRFNSNAVVATPAGQVNASDDDVDSPQRDGRVRQDSQEDTETEAAFDGDDGDLESNVDDHEQSEQSSIDGEEASDRDSTSNEIDQRSDLGLEDEDEDLQGDQAQRDHLAAARMCDLPPAFELTTPPSLLGELQEDKSACTLRSQWSQADANLPPQSPIS